MVRKLALAVSIALGTLNIPAHALGLGELSSQSALNQNFRGDIRLLSVGPEELDTVRASLADAEAFERAGIERPFYLSLLSFEPELTEKGAPVIRVTSEFPIREPFLNFMIEVNWPNGRLLREYTVLLDPPSMTKRSPPPVMPAARAPAAQPLAAAAGNATRVSQGASAAGGEYGPVQANDTAWGIAREVRPAGISMEQMMMALLDANPDAFIDNNINRLRRGRILRVPDSDEIRELSRQQAREAYRRQQDEWLARRDQQLQRSTGAQQNAAGAAAAQGDGGDVAQRANDQLRIATARPEGEGEAGAGDDDALTPVGSDLESRLIVARENVETSRLETQTLRSQVDDLQARLRDMQKLITLKDEQLAQLQDRVASDGEAATSPDAAGDELATAQDEEPAAASASEDSELSAVTLANQIGAVAEPVVEPDPVIEIEPEAQAASDPVIVEDGIVIDPAAELDGLIAEMAASSPAEATPAEATPASAPVEGRMLPSGGASGGEYRIQDIPPQVDADRVVEGFDEAVSAPESAPEVLAEGTEIVIDGTEGMPASSAENTDWTGFGQAGEPSAAAVSPEAEPVVATAQEAKASPGPTADSSDAVAPLVPPAVARLIEQNIVPIAGGGLALLALIGWLATRRKRQPDAAAEAPSAAMASAAPLARGEADRVDQPALHEDALTDLPDSAFLDEFSPSDINALQDETGEVDPVSEADVYIAYGRYQQAEELLRQALDLDPERLALKHKLLEVHYATRNADAFVAQMQNMVEAGQDVADEQAWVRALDMGRELDPAHPLFARKEAVSLQPLAAAGAAAAGHAAMHDETLAPDDFDLSTLTLNSAYEKEKEEASGASDNYQLDVPSEVSILLDGDVQPDHFQPAERSGLPDPIPMDELDGLDFSTPAAKPDTARDESDELLNDSFDLDSMMADAEAMVDGEESTLSLDSEFSAEELQAQLDELSDMSVLDSDLQDKPGEAAPQSLSPLGLGEEDTSQPTPGLDQPLSLDEVFDGAGSLEDQDSEMLELEEIAIVGEAGEEDDVATKLDLALAYFEMGDEDGARSILQEVVAEGSGGQRGEAEQLLSKLG